MSELDTLAERVKEARANYEREYARAKRMRADYKEAEATVEVAGKAYNEAREALLKAADADAVLYI